MTEEVKDEGRRRWLRKKSRSSIGISTAHEKEKQELEPKDLFKTKSGKEKRWFRKKSQSEGVKESSNGHGPQLLVNSETTDLEPAEEKPVQRKVQGFYRDNDGGPSPAILQTTVSTTQDAIKEFAKKFVSQLSAKPDLCAALEALMRQQLNLLPATPAATTDLRFLVQAYTALHLFSGFENASFGISNPGEKPWEVEQHMAICFEQFQMFKYKTETISKLLENKACDSFLSEFCTRKFKSLVPVDVESAMFGAHCEHHTDLLDQKHPETAFYKSFLGAAVSVWLLQRLRFSFEQKVVTISPTRGDEFQRRFMLPVVPGLGDNEDEESDHGLEVLYIVFPGFRVGESIVKSLVYIVERPILPSTEVATTATSAEEQSLANVENVATEDQTASNVDNAAAEEEIASTINNVAVEEAPESAEKNPSHLRSLSLPFTRPSTRKKESSEIKDKKSLSTRETSDTKGPKRGLFQRIRHKIFHKRTSKKAKAADNFSSPAVSPSAEGEPDAHQSTPAATSFAEGEPAAHQSTPATTSYAEGDAAAHQTTSAAATYAESELDAQDTPAVAAAAAAAAAATAITSVQGEISPFEVAPSSKSAEGDPAAHQSTPAAAAPVEHEPAAHQNTPSAALSAASEPAAQDTPAAATTSVQSDISPLEVAPSSKSAEGDPAAHQSTPAAATSPEHEPATHQNTPSATSSAASEPAAQDTPAAEATITSVRSEISPLEVAPSSPSAPPSADGEIEVSDLPLPKGPPSNTLD